MYDWKLHVAEMLLCPPWIQPFEQEEAVVADISLLQIFQKWHVFQLTSGKTL